MTFRVLTAAETDRPAWLAAWTAAGREPYAHPAYVELFAIDGGIAQCAVIEADGRVAVLPFVVRPVTADDWQPHRSARDAISPYGYGGPYGSKDDFPQLWAGVRSWMLDNGIVSFFGRLALGDDSLHGLPATADAASDTENVVVDLQRSAEGQWRTYEHKVRKNVNKAKRSGLTVEVRPTFSDVTEFTDLYHSTMDRRSASSWYYFDGSFFSTIARELPDNHIVAEVRADGRLVSAELVLTSDRFCYSYLGGTLGEAFELRPNDLLKHAVIDFGRQAGWQGYVLGGGLSRDDGLFRYKRAFDPSGCLPFYRLNLVCDEHRYQALTAERSDWLAAAGGTGELARSFFPAYRAPAVTTD